MSCTKDSSQRHTLDMKLSNTKCITNRTNLSMSWLATKLQSRRSNGLQPSFRARTGIKTSDESLENQMFEQSVEDIVLRAGAIPSRKCRSGI
jgi:hypothetical protein